MEKCKKLYKNNKFAIQEATRNGKFELPDRSSLNHILNTFFSTA